MLECHGRLGQQKPARFILGLSRTEIFDTRHDGARPPHMILSRPVDVWGHVDGDDRKQVASYSS